MWRLVLAHQKKRFGFVAIVQPGHGLVRRQIGCIAFESLIGSILLNEDRVVIAALPRKDLPVIKSNRIGLQVPLPDHSRAVAALL